MNKFMYRVHYLEAPTDIPSTTQALVLVEQEEDMYGFVNCPRGDGSFLMVPYYDLNVFASKVLVPDALWKRIVGDEQRKIIDGFLEKIARLPEGEPLIPNEVVQEMLRAVGLIQVN